MTNIQSKPRRGRPPKVSRENQDTKAELIRSGLEQLTEFGFSGSGIDQILKRIGIPKGSFYHYFSSKEAFGLAVIASYQQYFEQKLSRYLLDDAIAPLARINLFVEDAKRGMLRHQFKRGCLVGNLGQEVDLLPISFRPILINIFSQWQQKISACLELAKSQGQLSRQADCDVLAEVFWIGWEGAVSRAKLVQSVDPLTKFHQHFINALPK